MYIKFNCPVGNENVLHKQNTEKCVYCERDRYRTALEKIAETENNYASAEDDYYVVLKITQEALNYGKTSGK